MSATDELRRMLDERGVEYRWDNGTATWYVDGVMYNAWGFDNERLTMSVCHLTPEQAIAATLGSCGDSCNCTNGERTNLAAMLGVTDATPTRQDVAANVDEIIEQAIETTVGRGTCHIKEVASSNESPFDHSILSVRRKPPPLGVGRKAHEQAFYEKWYNLFHVTRNEVQAVPYA